MTTILAVMAGLALAFVALSLAIAWLPAGGFGTGGDEPR